MSVDGVVREPRRRAGPSRTALALRVNPELTDVKVDPEQVPGSGTLDQFIDHPRQAAGAGVRELFMDFGQSPTTFDERVDLAGRFIDGVRAG
ncbi:hypothetical protein [Streptomyces sp. NPDC060322]|uniref:hypothetical protein n=1 Tax=Streptomyces sp. NPDC060322 TaxID=3347097 RepID=UPI00365642FE